ncbi:MAG: class I mannose-6-phosphate isomerase [Bacillota bacterium]|nr:class I mannose-6-phosphate isomerase [Bacillota bacterium]
MVKPYRLTPAYKDVIWGGNSFKTLYNRDIPTNTTGEAFEASVVPGFFSSAEGISFPELIKDEKLTGTGGFNLLFKLIDARDNLSVQVHPDDELAAKLEGGRGKTECWYVLNAGEGSFLYLGFEKGVTKKDFERAVYHGGMEELLGKTYVKKGDFFFVPSGTVHAIGKGIVIAELQQSCDTTYRVYDYNRIDSKTGKERQLHKEKALIATNVTEYKSEPIVNITENREQLASCPYFEIERIKCLKEQENTKNTYVLLFFVEGSANIISSSGEVLANAGDTFFIPASLGSFTIEGQCMYLRMQEVF